MSKILYAASTMSHINSFHLEYIARLREEGHEVFTLANGEGADFDVPFEKKIFSSENKKCRKIISDIVNKNNFDVIILNTSLAAFHIRMALGKKRPRVVNIVHGYLFSEKEQGIKRKIKGLMLRYAELLLCGKTDALIIMNEEDERIATRHKLTSGEIINTDGFGVPRKSVKRGREDLRRELSAEGKYVLLFVGELSARKNEQFLIKAMPKILESIPEAELWLVGEGDERESLEELVGELKITDKVKLLGRQENPVDYMNAADVYVSASVSEGLPFNIVEALGAGRHVVATRVKGQWDILNGGAGFMYEQYDEAEYVRLLVGLHSGALTISSEKKEEAYLKYSKERVFPDTFEKIKKAARL